VADEGDGTIANAASDSLSGLEKWVSDGTTWHLVYTLQAGLNLGVPYVVPNPPGSPVYPNPATGGLRNLIGRRNGDGTVTLWAITSTVSQSGDQGADPNQLVMITDRLAAQTLPAGEHFTIIRRAHYGEVLRGVSFTPGTSIACGEDHNGGDQDDQGCENGQGHDQDQDHNQDRQ
jgi:hypothetical protein